MSLVSAIAFHGDEVAAEAQNRDPCLAATKLLITDPAAWKSQTRDECLVVQMSAGSRAVHKGAVNGQRRACSPSVAPEGNCAGRRSSLPAEYSRSPSVHNQSAILNAERDEKLLFSRSAASDRFRLR
ncbi:hypothetical protein KL929_005219 [Ogataea haglerorum]|nr:hypothetical protein KL912_005209 [Ogataea haglerorum]KAG7794286.1 hypothetical protein KL929_005219 [Ogataea haglerorum]